MDNKHVWLIDKINQHLAEDHERRGPDWLHSIHFCIPHAYYIPNKVFEGDDGRISQCLMMTEYIDAPNAKKFDVYAMEALEKNYGLVIMNDPERITGFEHHIRFGAIWSYLEFGNLNGAINQIEMFEQAREKGIADPMDAVLDIDKPRMILSTPSPRFFPEGLQRIMSGVTCDIFPGAEVEFHLIQEQQKAMPTSILLQIKNVEQEIDIPRFAEYLLWYMPPYLPLSIMQYSGDIKDVLFKPGADVTTHSGKEMNEELQKNRHPFPDAK